MALAGLSFDFVQTYGKEYILLPLILRRVGTSLEVEGRGWNPDGSESFYGSSVTESGDVFTVTLPGRGSVHRLLAFGSAVGTLPATVFLDTDPSRREALAAKVDLASPSGPSPLADGEELHLLFVVKNSNVD